MPSSPVPTKVRSTFNFLSLKWKILLTLGGVMLSVNGALSWLHFHDLTTRFDVQRTATRERLVTQALALRTDFGLRLQALAGMLAALDSVGVSLFQTRAGNALLRQHFDSYWSVLQLDLGLDSLQVYAASGPPLATWKTDVLAEIDQDAQVRAVIGQERAMHWTRCEQVCTSLPRHRFCRLVGSPGRSSWAVLSPTWLSRSTVCPVRTWVFSSPPALQLARTCCLRSACRSSA